MTELPGLPPFGAEPAFAADDAAYGAVALRARNRRRTRLAAVSAAAALVVAVATVSGPGAYDRVGLEPADDVPTATVTATPTGDRAPAPAPTGEPGEPGEPGGTGGSAAPGEPGPAASPDAGPTTEPGPLEPEPHQDCVDADGRLVACEGGGTSPPLAAQWRQTATYVDDRVTEECAPSPPGEGWCFRFLGPADTTAGTETTFTAELCRQPNGRDEPVVHFQYDANDELALALIGEGDGDDGTVEHTALSYLERREVPHSRTIASGRCLRWTVTWNGVGDDGRVLPPGAYTLTVMTNGHTPRTPLPGEADRSEKRAHGAQSVDFRIR